jgi:hypothetical protein
VTPDRAARVLRPLAAAVFLAGWAMAIASFFIIGTETCVTTNVPIVGGIETCQDTTSTAVVVVAAIGFGSTAASLVIWSISFVLIALEDIAANTRR